MMNYWRGLLVFALVSTSCVARVTVVPDPRVPHQLAEDADAQIWVRRADGTLAKQPMRIPAGWWVAGPLVTEPGP